MDRKRPTEIEKHRVPLETDLKIAERVHRSMIPWAMRTRADVIAYRAKRFISIAVFRL